ILAGESPKKKSSTTLTERSRMTELKTYIFAMTELNIVLSIIKHLCSSGNSLIKELSSSTKKKENTFIVNTLDIMIETLNDIGYVVDFDVLNSKYFGVPQNRERIFIVAIREDLVDSEPFSEESTSGQTIVPKGKRRIGEWAKTFNFDWPEQAEVTTRLRDILESNVDEKYYLDEEKTAKLVAQLEKRESPQVLRPQRTEYGKAIRKKYEAGEIKESRHNMTELQPREDGISNTLTTVEKDNWLAEPQMLGHVDIRGNDSIKRTYSTDGISPTLTTMGGGHREPKIAEERTPVQYNRKSGIGKELEQANTLSASDWRGLNRNQNQNAVLEEVRPVL